MSLHGLRWDDSLPVGYGLDENERCIELPLALEVAQLDTPGLVLDAGCSLNRSEVRFFDEFGWKARIWHYTQSLTAEPLGPLDSRVSYLCGDLRHLELANGTCDRVICVSTLEHIGMDNRTYGGEAECAPDTALEVVRELWRVLKPVGSLFLSFPYGQESQSCGGRYRTLQPTDVAAIQDIVGLKREIRYFRRTSEGWTDADERIARGLADGGKPVLGLCCLRAW